MKETVAVVDHHGNGSIPYFFDGKTLDQVDETAQYITWILAMTSQDYPFLWNKQNFAAFKEAVATAGRAYLTGRLEVLSEGQKTGDVICQACKNLIGGKCIYDENGDIF